MKLHELNELTNDVLNAGPANLRPAISDALLRAVAMTEADPLNMLAARVHAANAKWWIDIHTGHPIRRNVGELLMLCVSELAEALEGDRKGMQDDKLPHRTMFEVEITDCLIRLLDIAGGMKLDLGGAFEEKMAYNAVRHDHSVEGRKAAEGKKY